MKTIGMVKVTKEMENVIRTKVHATNQPYIFKIKGTPGGGYDTYKSAALAWEKLKAWTESLYGFAELIEDTYTEPGKTSYKYLKVKITDPAAFPIEKILEEQGRLK